MTFKEFLVEKLTRKTDYTIESEEMKNLFNQVINSRKLLELCTFKVNDFEFYCYIIKNERYLEPHFGTFTKDNAIEFIRNNYKDKAEELKKEKFFMNKNGELDEDVNFSAVLSYVYSILADWMVKNKKRPSLIRIVGSKEENKKGHSKYGIYRNMLSSMIKNNNIPYRIQNEIEVDNIDKDQDSIKNLGGIILVYDPEVLRK